MAITFLCPSCGAVASVPDESRGMTGVCGQCKLRLKVPTAVKFCVACHKDVASEKRIKDTNGFYYCAPCYTKRLARKEQGIRPEAATVPQQKRPAENADAVDPTPAAAVESLEPALSLDDLPTEGKMAARQRKAVASVSGGEPSVVTTESAASQSAKKNVADEYDLVEPEETPRARVPVASTAPTPSNANAGELDLADDVAPPPVKKTAPPPIPATTSSPVPAGESELPAKCPSCNTPRIGKSPWCVGCKRDLRQMGNLIKMQEDTSEDKANRIAKIIGRSIAGVVIVAVALVVGWAVWVRVLDMMGPAKDVWPEKVSELTDNQKKEIDEDFHHLQDVAAMVQIVQDGQRLKANFGWWMGHDEESKQNIVKKLSLYAQMHCGKSDVVVVAESGITLAEKKDGKIMIVQKPVEPVEPLLGP